MTSFRDKHAARSWAKAKVETLPEQDKAVASRKMCELLADHFRHIPPRCVFTFYPTEREPDLTALPRLLPECLFALPVVAKGYAMDFHLWQHNEPLRSNRFGIREPDPTTSAKIEPTELDLILVPCLVGDRLGRRVGHGVGYYDRYLARYSVTPTILVLFEALLVDCVPHERHDLPCRMLLSERQLRRL